MSGKTIVKGKWPRKALAGGAFWIAILAAALAAIALAGAPAPAMARNAADEDALSGHAKLAPFSGVRWGENIPEVQLDGAWYRLMSIDGVGADAIVAFCRTHYEQRWRKRFEEDLVAVLSQMGHKAGDTVTLVVKTLDRGTLVTREKVPMTAENRAAIWRASHPRQQ
jgi:hypothetical protein